MADMTAAVTISIIDKWATNARKFKSDMKSMKDAVSAFAGGVKSGIQKELIPHFDAKNFDKKLKDFDARIAKSRSKLLGAAAMALTIAAPLKKAAQFDQAFKGLEKVVDAPISRLKELRKFALETSTLVPLAARDIIELMSEAKQGGVPLAELEKFSLFTAKAAVAFDMAGALIGGRFAELRNVYKLNQDGIEKLANATNHLSNNFAAKAKQITNFTNRSAGAAAILKTTAVEMSAIGTAMIASGIVPETAARGVNTFAARIVKGGKKVEAAFAMIGTSRAAFMEAVKKDGAQAFNELFKTLSKSEKGMRSLIDLVGMDFTDDFAKLLGNPKLLDKTLKAIADKSKYDGSVIQEAAKQASGAEKNLELFGNKVTAASITLGTTLLPRLLEVTDALGGMVTKFSDFATANPELASTMTTVVAGMMSFFVATRLLGFAWAFTGKKLLEGIGLFAKFSNGKNISKLGPLMSKAATAVAVLPGPLKLLAVGALVAAAAFVILDNDTDNLRKNMAEDPEGFKQWEERLFGVADAADGAAGAIGRLNKAETAIRLNKSEEAYKAQKEETIEAITDAVETSLFDKSSDDFSASGKTAFGPVLQTLAKKMKDGSFKPEDVEQFKQKIDQYFSQKVERIAALDTSIASDKDADNLSPGRRRALVGKQRERNSLQGDFDQDVSVMKLVKQQITAAAKLQADILQAKSHLNGTAAKSAPGANTKPAELAKKLEISGDTAGKKLGQAANSQLDGMAATIGAQIGRAAAAEINKAAVNVNVGSSTGGRSKSVSGAKASALHDGVD